MAKNYFYIILLVFISFLSTNVVAQETKPMNNTQETSLDGISLYPNPVSNGKVYITSKNSLSKEILIVDVMGKVVLQTTIQSKELNVSNLLPGVYIIKIKEGDITATRKLIVK
jgi:hypothetical protein